jgi:type IV secretory pathway ATPase VirB11/archaellum biosynthesis ATPase
MTAYWLSFGTHAVCTGILIVEADTLEAAIMRSAELVPEPLVHAQPLVPATPEGHRLLALMPRDELMPRAEVRRLEQIAKRRPD